MMTTIKRLSNALKIRTDGNHPISPKLLDTGYIATYLSNIESMSGEDLQRLLSLIGKIDENCQISGLQYLRANQSVVEMKIRRREFFEIGTDIKVPESELNINPVRHNLESE